MPLYRMTERTIGRVYQPGDVVTIAGGKRLPVDNNHCGFPWPVALDGAMLYGVIVVHPYIGKSLYMDAVTGEELDPDELYDREGNPAWDYERRAQSNTGRRYPIPSFWSLLIAPVECFCEILRVAWCNRHLRTARRYHG